MSARIGSLFYVVAGTLQPVESDEESTEPVNQRKPVMMMDTPMPMMEEDLWWRMNQDFALGSDEEDDSIIPTSRNIPLNKLANKAAVARTPSSPLVGADEWMALNQGFACDHSHDEEMDVEEQPAPAKKAVPSLQEPLGDYGVWWE